MSRSLLAGQVETAGKIAVHTHDGFQVVSAKAATSLANDGGFLDLRAADGATAPANVFGLELLLDERALGPYVFVDENYATCERCVRIEAGCSSQGPCTKTFLVHAGQMDITAQRVPESSRSPERPWMSVT